MSTQSKEALLKIYVEFDQTWPCVLKTLDSSPHLCLDTSLPTVIVEGLEALLDVQPRYAKVLKALEEVVKNRNGDLKRPYLTIEHIQEAMGKL